MRSAPALVAQLFEYFLHFAYAALEKILTFVPRDAYA